MTSLPNDVYLPETANHSSENEILILTADGVEDLEFFYPYYRFIEAGFSVDVVTPEGKALKCKKGLGLKETMKISDVDAADYKLLYIPGGKAPAELKKRDDVIALTKQFYSLGKPISAICHGPQILAAAKIIAGRKIAAWPEVESEIREADGIFVNKGTVIDGPFVTARWPGDLPAHLMATLTMLSHISAMPEPRHVAA
jgi:protease I